MTGPTEKPKPRRGRSRLSWMLTAGSVVLVFALLALLVQRVVAGNRGKELVSAVRDGKEPLAPSFRHPVIWPHTESWPAQLRSIVEQGTVSPRDLIRRPVVINFWASWCIPCKREAPRLNASARQHRGQVVFLGVDVQDFTRDARRFLRRHHVNYVAVRARGDSTYSDYGLTGVPETYYLDTRGRIRAHSLGEVSRRELESGISQVVGQEP